MDAAQRIALEFPHHPAGMLVSSGGWLLTQGWQADRKHTGNKKPRQELIRQDLFFHQNVA